LGGLSAKKAVNSQQKKTLIGSTKTKEEVKIYSFIYQKTALLRATKFSQNEIAYSAISMRCALSGLCKPATKSFLLPWFSYFSRQQTSF
jgi:hypothetical protein